MLRKPFYLPTSGITLVADPVWVGEVVKNPLPLAPYNRSYLLNIGTANGTIVEAWSEKEFLDSLRLNLLKPPYDELKV